MPLARTLDHELEMLLALRGLIGVSSLAFDTLVKGAIVSTPVLQPLTLAAIWRGRLHLAVPALVSTFKVCVCKHAAVWIILSSCGCGKSQHLEACTHCIAPVAVLLYLRIQNALRCFPSVGSQEAHNLGFVNRDVRLSNLMTDTTASVLWPIDWGSATRVGLQQAPFEGTVHYASKAILEQVILEQLLQPGQHPSVRATPADDLESLVCTAFCVTHPDMQVELEKLPKHQLGDIVSWWQHTAWASRPAWTEALQAARDLDYTGVGVQLQRLLE